MACQFLMYFIMWVIQLPLVNELWQTESVLITLRVKEKNPECSHTPMLTALSPYIFRSWDEIPFPQCLFSLLSHPNCHEYYLDCRQYIIPNYVSTFIILVTAWSRIPMLILAFLLISIVYITVRVLFAALLLSGQYNWVGHRKNNNSSVI